MDRVVDRFFTAVNDIHTAAEKGDADKVQRLAKDLSLYLRGVQTVADLTPSGLENVPGVASMSDYDWKRWRKIPEIASKKLAPGSPATPVDVILPPPELYTTSPACSPSHLHPAAAAFSKLPARPHEQPAVPSESESRAAVAPETAHQTRVTDGGALRKRSVAAAPSSR
eukprot:ctg_762.g368